MSLKTAKQALRLDKIVKMCLDHGQCRQNPNNPDELIPVTGKQIIGAIAAIQVMKDLSLPTSAVAAVDEYWWANHHERVSKQISHLNEVYPIPVPAVMAMARELYRRRYYCAYPRTVDDLSRLWEGCIADEGADLVHIHGVANIDTSFNTTVQEILNDAL